ncbi:MAG: hypothetical protein LQ341_003934 [Variospora aurantia]|nr:MAG: hypothetical protein LQ341_003934 [Variospora aurantia]
MDPSTLSKTDDNVSPSLAPTTQNEGIPNKPVTFWHRAYRSMGFQKGYNFSLFIIFAGAIVGFSLARLSYLNISGSASSSYASGAAPGEWYWYSRGIYRIGITIHLATILPAGLLMVWQFIPIIRHKALIFHRINGYLVITLVIISNVGALMIARRAFGGSLETQAGVGVLVIISTTSIALAYYNIKRLQIDQHRAWMLRAMFYLGTIVTLRLIMILSALISSKASYYNTTMTCGELLSILDTNEKVNSSYPQCGQPGSTADTRAIVQAKFGTQPEQIGASLRMSFGMALWLALFLHAAGVEIYLHLTPRENNRLRQVSYEKQMEKGLSPAGSAGLTSDRWGDAEPWKPMKEGTEA